jgi:hypothetical protein
MSQTAYQHANGRNADEANWLATALGRGFFAIFRLHGPEQPAIDYG